MDGAGGARGATSEPAAGMPLGARRGIPTAESLAETAAAPGAHIAIVYGSNLLAEYEHCGCPSHPMGGLARRATVVDRARSDGAAVLLVDAGDALLPLMFHPPAPLDPPGTGPTTAAVPAMAWAAPRPGELERRADLILAAYARMGMAAAGALLPAERELALGLPTLKRLLAVHRVPAVASNLSLRGDGTPAFARDRLLTLAGVPIGVFGIVVPQPEDRAAWLTFPVRVDDPVATARAEIASLRQRGARVVVALIHVGSNEAARQLLAAAPGVDFAIQGHTQMQTETVDTVGATRRVEALALGKLAGRLDVHVVEAAPAGAAADALANPSPYFQPGFTDRGDRAQLRTILADHQRQRADLEKRASEDKTNQLEGYYRSRREGLTAAMAREEGLLARLPRTISGSWFENRLIPLDESVPDQVGVGLLVAAYNARSVRRAAAGLPVGVDWRRRDGASPSPLPSPSPNPRPNPSPSLATRYLGSAACASCHPQQMQQYLTTKHARALGALAAIHRDRDPACVGCHVTGYLLPGGPTRLADAIAVPFKDVGCESCHGPGAAHVAASAADKRGTLPRHVDGLVCRGCHTPDQTNGEFDDAAFRAAILGAGHGAG